MAQEVQTTLDYQTELNEIEWIWYSQRRISDKMQVRDKIVNSATFSSWGKQTIEGTDVYMGPRTLSSSVGWVTYKTSGSDIYIPLAWAYMIEYLGQGSYSQSLGYTFKIRCNGEVIYTLNTTLGDTYNKSGGSVKCYIDNVEMNNIKSIDGLIDVIKDFSDDTIRVSDVIKIIKEYCEIWLW